MGSSVKSIAEVRVNDGSSVEIRVNDDQGTHSSPFICCSRCSPRAGSQVWWGTIYHCSVHSGWSKLLRIPRGACNLLTNQGKADCSPDHLFGFFLQTMPYLFFSSPWVVPSHDNISKMTGVAFLQHWSFLPAPLGTAHLVLWAWSQEMGWKIFTLWFCNSCAVEVRGTQSCVPSSHSCCHAPDRPVLCIQGSWTFLSAQIYLLTGCSVDWLLIVALAHPGHAGALEWFQGHLAMAAFPRWLERSMRASLWCSACWC